MYSAILMAAMATGTADAPAWGGKAIGCGGGMYLHSYGGCCGGYGSCWGAYAAWGGGGCNGSWSGCYGSGYGGCYGSGYGGCYGSGYGGCYGSGYGSFHGGGCYGCMGCYGSYDVGCYGGHGGYAAPTYPSNPMTAPVTGTTPAPTTAPPPAAAPPTTPPTTPPVTPTTPPVTPGAAKLMIEMPTDAKLFVDDMPIRTATGKNTFATPALEAGQAYFYTVRVEAVRDGKPVSESRRVVVRAGETVTESFEPTVATASAK